MWRSRRAHRIVQAVLLCAAITPVLVPWLEARPSTSALGAALRAGYGLQCHQRMARTFSWMGQALPICARCFGIYVGLGLAALVGRPRLRPDPLKAWYVVGVLFVVADVASEWVGLRPPSAWLRALTGAFLSYGIAIGILSAVRPRIVELQ